MTDNFTFVAITYYIGMNFPKLEALPKTIASEIKHLGILGGLCFLSFRLGGAK